MDIDIDVLKKEMDYIILKIRNCKNVNELAELHNTLFVLNSLYNLHTNFDYQEIEKNGIYISEYDEIIEQIEQIKIKKIVSFYMRDYKLLKALYENVIYTHEKEIANDEILELSISYDNMREIAIDFYSQYGSDILSIVNKFFDNKQIQIVTDEMQYRLYLESSFKYYINKLIGMNPLDYTESTYNKFELIYEECFLYKDRLRELSISDIYRKIEKLLTAYYYLKPINKKVMLDEIEYDEEEDTYGITYDMKPLSKDYIVIYDDVNYDTLFALIHEIGHAIEDEILLYRNKSNVNSKFDTNIDSLYMGEFLPAIFEIEFLKYLKSKSLFLPATLLAERNYKHSLISNFSKLRKIKNDFYSLNQLEFEDAIETIKYSVPYYLAILLSKKYGYSPEILFDLCEKVIKNREELSLGELINLCDISYEFYESNIFDEEFKLIRN